MTKLGALPGGEIDIISIALSLHGAHTGANDPLTDKARDTGIRILQNRLAASMYMDGEMVVKCGSADYGAMERSRIIGVAHTL